MTHPNVVFPHAPKRVLFTADTAGGVWTYAMELLNALAPFGVHFTLATMGRPLGPEQRCQVASMANVELEESAFKLEWMAQPWEDVQRAGDWLLHLEQQYKPDLIHLNGFAHGSLAWSAPKLVVGHSCVLSWWKAVHGGDAPTSWSRYWEATTRGLRAADMVVAPTAAMMSLLQAHYGPLPVTQVISNGRSLPALTQRPKEPFILSAGRLWDAAKNLQALERIAPDLPWPVYVAGEPELAETNSADNAVTHLEASDVPRGRQVQPLGFLPGSELLSWFERAAIYALPARYEPFGLSILEAALAGCALVLGDIPSLRELWDGAAIFVPPNEPETLEDALKELISSAAWRAGLASQARRLATRYTPEIMAASYFEIYQHILRSREVQVSAAVTGDKLQSSPSAVLTLPATDSAATKAVAA